MTNRTRAPRTDAFSSQATVVLPVVTEEDIIRARANARIAAAIASTPESRVRPRTRLTGPVPIDGGKARTGSRTKPGLKSAVSKTKPEHEAASSKSKSKEIERIREPRPETAKGPRTVAELDERKERAYELRRKIVLIAAITISVLALALVMIYPAAQNYYQTYRENQKLEAEAAALDARNTQLQDNIDYLNTDEGIEDQAREYGWVETGETSVSVSGTDRSASSTSMPTPVESDTVEVPHTWATNILDVVFGVSL